MFSFLAISLNCTDWAITGRIARVQFNSTLERKVKTGAMKDIFLVCKWINNTIKSNSVRCHMRHRKNLSFLSSFGLRVVFVKGSKIAVFVSIVASKRARRPPLFITFLSSSWLVSSVYQVSSTIYVRFFYWGITLNMAWNYFLYWIEAAHWKTLLWLMKKFRQLCNMLKFIWILCKILCLSFSVTDTLLNLA